MEVARVQVRHLCPGTSHMCGVVAPQQTGVASHHTTLMRRNCHAAVHAQPCTAVLSASCTRRRCSMHT